MRPQTACNNGDNVTDNYFIEGNKRHMRHTSSQTGHGGSVSNPKSQMLAQTAQR